MRNHPKAVARTRTRLVRTARDRKSEWRRSSGCRRRQESARSHHLVWQCGRQGKPIVAQHDYDEAPRRVRRVAWRFRPRWRFRRSRLQLDRGDDLLGMKLPVAVAPRGLDASSRSTSMKRARYRPLISTATEMRICSRLRPSTICCSGTSTKRLFKGGGNATPPTSGPRGRFTEDKSIWTGTVI